MNTFTLNVLAAEKPFFEGDCISLVIPTNDGQYGILAKHNNMIAAIVPGVLKIKAVDPLSMAVSFRKHQEPKAQTKTSYLPPIYQKNVPPLLNLTYYHKNLAT